MRQVKLVEMLYKISTNNEKSNFLIIFFHINSFPSIQCHSFVSIPHPLIKYFTFHRIFSQQKTEINLIINFTVFLCNEFSTLLNFILSHLYLNKTKTVKKKKRKEYQNTFS